VDAAGVQVTSKIICKKNAVSVQESWGAGQLSNDQNLWMIFGLVT
jgi:hypothetical protein